ncbi:Monocarboxylate transporter 2 [Holothuria leucospilota]|uniref:Monocarboxylate transporter 2 n=1 Tax=Holothuria leucospilota TaxID=206669 RepID=A0A9Q1C0C3_HOLLE|nr:Monocarboxylate transporter 2 [Holothuria leucospilota]
MFYARCGRQLYKTVLLMSYCYQLAQTVNEQFVGRLSMSRRHLATMGYNENYQYFSAVVSRCIFEFLLGGSMKAYGLMTTFVTEKLAISHSVLGLILCLQQSVGYLTSPVISQLVTYYGIRPVALLGGLLFGLGYFGQSFFHNHVVFFIIFCTCSGFGTGCLTLSSYFHMLQVFGDGFGLATSITSQCLFLGVCLIPLIFEHLWDQFGLHGALLIFSAFCWNCIISAVLMKPTQTKLSETVTECSKEDEEANSNSIFIKLKQLFLNMKQLVNKHKTIPLLLVIVYVHFACYFSWALFLVPVAEQRGFDKSSAVLLSTAGGVGGILGRTGCSILFALNNTQPFFHFFLPLVLQTIAFVGVAYSKTMMSLLVFSGLSGFTLGFIDGSLPGFIPLNLSKAEIPVAFTIHFLVYAVGMESGSYLAGLMFDIFASYTAVFVLEAVFSVIAALSAVIWQLSFISRGVTQ